MIVDRKYVQSIRTHGQKDIPAEIEAILIKRFGKEPYPHTYSEQDLYEQTRKVINRYSTPRGRLEVIDGVDLLENELERLNGNTTGELLDAGEF